MPGRRWTSLPIRRVPGARIDLRGRHLRATTSPSSAVASLIESRLERLCPDAKRLFELRVGDDERSEDADAVAVDAAGDEHEAARERGGDDGAGELGRGLPR